MVSVGLVRNCLMMYLGTHHMIPKGEFLEYLKRILFAKRTYICTYICACYLACFLAYMHAYTIHFEVAFSYTYVYIHFLYKHNLNIWSAYKFKCLKADRVMVSLTCHQRKFHTYMYTHAWWCLIIFIDCTSLLYRMCHSSTPRC